MCPSDLKNIMFLFKTLHIMKLLTKKHSVRMTSYFTLECICPSYLDTLIAYLYSLVIHLCGLKRTVKEIIDIVRVISA